MNIQHSYKCIPLLNCAAGNPAGTSVFSCFDQLHLCPHLLPMAGASFKLRCDFLGLALSLPAQNFSAICYLGQLDFWLFTLLLSEDCGPVVGDFLAAVLAGAPSCTCWWFEPLLTQPRDRRLSIGKVIIFYENVFLSLQVKNESFGAMCFYNVTVRRKGNLNVTYWYGYIFSGQRKNKKEDS